MAKSSTPIHAWRAGLWVGPASGRTRAAWKAAGREGRRDLVSVAYFAPGDEDFGIDELMLTPTVDEAWLADAIP